MKKFIKLLLLFTFIITMNVDINAQRDTKSKDITVRYNYLRIRDWDDNLERYVGNTKIRKVNATLKISETDGDLYLFNIDGNKLKTRGTFDITEEDGVLQWTSIDDANLKIVYTLSADGAYLSLMIQETLLEFTINGFN